jgi:hypothetical protein
MTATCKKTFYKNIEDFSDKTFSRYIAFLKRVGVPIHYSARRKAYVQINKDGKVSRSAPFNEPDYMLLGKKQQMYLDKIRRLMTIMDSAPYIDVDIWYQERFPKLSKRTMQRDFAELRKIKHSNGEYNYGPYYKRGWEQPGIEWNDDEPLGHYYCSGITDA